MKSLPIITSALLGPTHVRFRMLSAISLTFTAHMDAVKLWFGIVPERYDFSRLLLAVGILTGSVGANVSAEASIKDLTAIQYGPHKKNVLSFFPAEGEGPRPLLIHVHGGGWSAGGRSTQANKFKPFLKEGISGASISYRLLDDSKLPAPVIDVAYAIQFLRYHAAELNIDKDRIAIFGESAGGCTALWIATHDDLADPDADDPVLRESSRVVAAAGFAPQTAIDPELLKEWIGDVVLQHSMISGSVEGGLGDEENNKEVYKEFSAYYHLTADDPPMHLHYNADDSKATNKGHGIHHPAFGIHFKEKADELAVECGLSFRKSEAKEAVEAREARPEPKPMKRKYGSQNKFLIWHLLND